MVAALALLLAGCASHPAAWAERASVQASADVWITTSDHRQLLAHASIPSGTIDASHEAVSVIDVAPTQRFQQVAGFGAALTDASSWLLQQRMTPQQRQALLQELYSRKNDGLGFAFLRLTIGASDFSRHHYSLDDSPDGKPDPQLLHFSLAPNREDVIPVAQQIVAINPQLRIMASPWSAPAWMKDSDSLITGRLRPEYYAAFSRYLLRYIEAMAEAGVRIDALSVQNEPDFEPRDYPGMRLNAPQRARLIGDHLGPLLAQHAPQVQLWDWDHNWDKPAEPLAVLVDPVAARYVSAVAWHCYGGDSSAQTRVHAAHPTLDMYMTECSGGDWEPLHTGGLTLQARQVLVSTMRHWARGVLLWNLALDESNGPHTGGCGNCRGVVTIDSRTGEVTRTDDYYVLAHASRFVRRGAWRVASTEGQDGVDNVAFVNADDGSRVLIVVNSNPETRRIGVREGARSFEWALQGKSVATLRWHSAAH